MFVLLLSVNNLKSSELIFSQPIEGYKKIAKI